MIKDKHLLFLIVAIIVEMFASTFLSLSSGMTKLFPAIIALVAYLCSYYLLARALKKIPIGLAYAIWAGVGIVATSLINYFLFGIMLSPGSILGLLLILSGVLTINLLATNELSKSAVTVRK